MRNFSPDNHPGGDEPCKCQQDRQLDQDANEFPDHWNDHQETNRAERESYGENNNEIQRACLQRSVRVRNGFHPGIMSEISACFVVSISRSAVHHLDERLRPQPGAVIESM